MILIETWIKDNQFYICGFKIYIVSELQKNNQLI